MKIYFIQFTEQENLPIPFMKKVRTIIDDEDMENMIIGASYIGDYSIICAEEYKILKFIELSQDYNMVHSYKDITDDLVMGNPVNDLVDSLKGDEVLESLMLQVMTIDMVLDKISSKGMDSLTAIDMVVLNT
jgi:hypothetical protein